MRNETSLLDIALRRAVHEKLQEDSKWGGVLAIYATGMQSGEYDERLLDAVVQGPGRAFTIYDAYCYATIHADVLDRRIRVCAIPVGVNCYPNSAKSQMNAVLASLESPFFANFKGDSDDADGMFGWKRPLLVNDSAGREFHLPPANLPLEVGYVQSVTVWNHINLRGAVARWPYARQEITLLMKVEGA